MAPKTFKCNDDADLRPTIKSYRPRSLKEFHKGSNAPKREYATSSFAQDIANAMDPQLRNGLGHFSARLDGSASLVSYPADLSGSETLQLPYASFLLRLVRLSMRIQEVVYFIKFLRVYVSRKPEKASAIHYGVNSLGLVIAAGGEETDREPCGNCGHPLVDHTGTPGVLREFAPILDCDRCVCIRFTPSAPLYQLDDRVRETRLR